MTASLLATGASQLAGQGGAGGGGLSAPSSAASKSDSVAKLSSSVNVGGVVFDSPFNVGSGSDSMNNIVVIGGLLLGLMILTDGGFLGGKGKKKRS